MTIPENPIKTTNETSVDENYRTQKQAKPFRKRGDVICQNN